MHALILVSHTPIGIPYAPTSKRTTSNCNLNSPQETATSYKNIHKQNSKTPDLKEPLQTLISLISLNALTTEKCRTTETQVGRKREYHKRGLEGDGFSECGQQRAPCSLLKCEPQDIVCNVCKSMCKHVATFTRGVQNEGLGHSIDGQRQRSPPAKNLR